MPSLLPLMWLYVGLAGETTLAVHDRELEVSLDTALPDQTSFLVSYVLALREPDRAGDGDRVWGFPQRPEATAFSLRGHRQTRRCLGWLLSSIHHRNDSRW